MVPVGAEPVEADVGERARRRGAAQRPAFGRAWRRPARRSALHGAAGEDAVLLDEGGEGHRARGNQRRDRRLRHGCVRRVAGDDREFAPAHGEDAGEPTPVDVEIARDIALRVAGGGGRPVAQRRRSTCRSRSPSGRGAPPAGSGRSWRSNRGCRRARPCRRAASQRREVRPDLAHRLPGRRHRRDEPLPLPVPHDAGEPASSKFQKCVCAAR